MTCVDRVLLVMNILMSTFRLQLIACHSTCLTALIEKDNQSLQPENTFSRKRFHTQLQKYLLAHRYSNQLRTAFRTRARLVCHLVFILFPFSTYASKVVILCRNDLENGKPENLRSNAGWKYQDQIATIFFQIFCRHFRLFTKSPSKRRFSMYFVVFNIRDN